MLSIPCIARISTMPFTVPHFETPPEYLMIVLQLIEVKLKSPRIRNISIHLQDSMGKSLSTINPSLDALEKICNTSKIAITSASFWNLGSNMLRGHSTSPLMLQSTSPIIGGPSTLRYKNKIKMVDPACLLLPNQYFNFKDSVDAKKPQSSL